MSKYHRKKTDWEKMKKGVDEMFPTKRQQTARRKYQHPQETPQRHRNGYPLDSPETKQRVMEHYHKRKEKKRDETLPRDAEI